MSKQSLLVTSSIFAAVAFSSTVHAQASVDQASTATNSQPTGEIVVTATKRETTILKTPMSITSVSGKDLEGRGITHLEDAIRDIPSVSVRSAGPGQTELEMRGLSSSGGAAPTVGFYLDDVPLTPPVASQGGKTVIDPSLYDLARVEVLRGPQGTLYGGGSMGGTIRLITNQPQLNTFSGSINADASYTARGNTPNGAINAAINIPLIQDKLAIRLVGTETYDSGWIDRVVLSNFPFPTNNGCAVTPFAGCARGDVLAANVAHRYRDVNWTHTTAARGAILFQPVENVKSTTTGLYQITRQGGSNTFDLNPGVAYLAHYQATDTAEPYSDRFWMVANSTRIDLSAVSINLATSYWNRYQTVNQDGAEGGQAYFGFTQFPTSGRNEINPGSFPSHQFSEELRLSSNTTGRFSWIVGAFYENLTSIATSFAGDPGICGLTVTTQVATPICMPGNSQGVEFNSVQKYKVRQYAFFGELSYKILDNVNFTAGGRYFNFNNTLNQVESGYFTPSLDLTPTFINTVQKNHGFTPKFNLSYEPSNRLTLYTTVAEGFRPGGVNQGVPATCNVLAEGYNPDTIWSYEGGEKWRSSDGKLSINADFYFNRWRNIQQLVTPPCGFGFTANAGDADTYGPELELTYRLTPQLTFSANGTYTHAKITDSPPGSSFAVGQQILNIPRYQAHASLAYRKELGNGLSLTARVEDTLVGKVEDVAYTYIELPHYNLVDLRFGVEKGPGSITLYVNNVTNTHAEISANNTGLTTNLPQLYRIATNQPTTGGVNFRYDF